eukprot:m.270573 g.270573  ORF g.270573 m.270573 type:complete len:428 (-) comp11083_c1_seq10:73-1356(-)
MLTDAPSTDMCDQRNEKRRRFIELAEQLAAHLPALSVIVTKCENSRHQLLAIPGILHTEILSGLDMLEAVDAELSFLESKQHPHQALFQLRTDNCARGLADVCRAGAAALGNVECVHLGGAWRAVQAAQARLSEAIQLETAQSYSLDSAETTQRIQQILASLLDHVRTKLAEAQALMARIAKLQASARDMLQHATKPSLEAITTQLKALKKLQRESGHLRLDIEGGHLEDEELADARDDLETKLTAVRAAQRTLSDDLSRLCVVASEHWPELLVALRSKFESQLRDILHSGRVLWQHGSLDDYTDVTTIHQGHNTVYTAMSGSVKVVIKQYLLSDPSQVRAVERELRSLSRLSHPNVIPVKRGFHSGKEAFIELPFYRRGTLAAWLEGLPLPRVSCWSSFPRRVNLSLLLSRTSPRLDEARAPQHGC